MQSTIIPLASRQGRSRNGYVAWHPFVALADAGALMAESVRVLRMLDDRTVLDPFNRRERGAIARKGPRA